MATLDLRSILLADTSIERYALKRQTPRNLDRCEWSIEAANRFSRFWVIARKLPDTPEGVIDLRTTDGGWYRVPYRMWTGSTTYINA